MQFNSYIFILCFLPLTIAACTLTRRLSLRTEQLVLIAAGVVFYACGSVKTLPLLILSLAVNFAAAMSIKKMRAARTTAVTGQCAAETMTGDKPGASEITAGFCLAVPVIFNVGLLCCCKYLDFASDCFLKISGRPISLHNLALPIGISFITFQQIAYDVSVYRGEIADCGFAGDLLDYLTFLLYFPKLLMGPLMEPSEFLRRFRDPVRRSFAGFSADLASGLKLLGFGLFKKVFLADTAAAAVNLGFGSGTDAFAGAAVSAGDWFFLALLYTFEIYFDFSGYCDMAAGVSKMLRIDLPMNFDSPYRALSIRDFWKRWHMTLTAFFTKYIYIPLGGSRRGKLRTCVNTLIVFLISGLWHGAGITFLLWGLLHGLLMIWDRFTLSRTSKLPKILRWILTFAALNALWFLFRADSFQIRAAGSAILASLRNGISGLEISASVAEALVIPELTFLLSLFGISTAAASVQYIWAALFAALCLFICLVPENNIRRADRLTAGSAIAAAAALAFSILTLGGESVFVYFNF